MYTSASELQVAHSLAASGQPETGFFEIAKAFSKRPGFRLFTILRYDPAAALIRRIWTSHETEYPVGGAKPISDTPWTRQVLESGLPYVGRNSEDIRSVFFDHELIASLGCASVLNLPVRWDGKIIGSLNLLHEAHHYDDVDPAELAIFVQMAIAGLNAVNLSSYG